MSIIEWIIDFFIDIFSLGRKNDDESNPLVRLLITGAVIVVVAVIIWLIIKK